VPRIRSIKPEFFTSEKIVECSPTARLLFVGMWCFCDDGGVHPASVKRLKMEVFPGDDFPEAQMQNLVKELLDAKLLAEFEAQGEKYWHVTGWHNQKIDRPNMKHPQPEIRRAFDEHSTNGSGAIDDRSPPEGNGKEGRGRERKG